MKPLSPKQARFVAEYLVDLNATQAAVRAGYSPKTANEQGARLLANASVAQAVATKQEKRLTKLEITAERVLTEMARIGFSDVRDWFDEQGRLRPLQDLPEDAARAIASVEVLREKVTRFGDETSGAKIEEAVIKVRAWDKVQALQMLAKNLGLLKTQVEVSGNIGVEQHHELTVRTRIVLDELASRIAGSRALPAGVVEEGETEADTAAR